MASSGNFCTWNPLDPIDSNITLSQGNTRSLCPASGYPETYGNFGMRSGKWYAEFYLDYVQGGSSSYFAIGIAQQNAKLYSSTPGLGRTNTIIYLGNNGKTEKDGTVQSYGNTYGQGHTIGIAFDADNGKIYFSKNGTFQNSGNPANGTNPAYTSIDLTDDWFFSFTDSYNGQNGSLIINTGQDSTFGGNETAGGNADANGFGDFRYAPPTGFLALCSANLPISADIDPAQTDDDFSGKQFNCITYTGNAGSNAISGLGFKPDFCWIKKRNGTGGAAMVNSTIGGQKVLQSNNTDAEGSSSPFQTFDADGFTLDGTSSYLGNFNGSSDTYVAWCWRANGGTTASNSSGSITASVQANTAAGFSIATYTSPGSGTNHTVGHGLSGVDFIITKDRDSTFNWYCFHKSVPDKTFRLNSTTANFSYSNWSMGSSTWGSEDGYTHNSTDKFVAYCWQNVEGFQKFGTYVGNGNTDGPFIYTGFRPRFIITKSSTTTSGWNLRDSARSTSNPVNRVSQADTTSAELTSNYDTDFLSNGFKIRASGADSNSNGDTYFYAAWGDVPFKYNNTF